jgi:hypothetical protein
LKIEEVFDHGLHGLHGFFWSGKLTTKPTFLDGALGKYRSIACGNSIRGIREIRGLKIEEVFDHGLHGFFGSENSRQNSAIPAIVEALPPEMLSR